MDGSSKAYVYTVDGNRAAAQTKLKPSGEDAAREPAILRGLTGDLYLAPTPPEDAREEILLKRGKMQMDDLFAYRYEDVTMEPEGDHLRVTADVAITDGETVEHAAPVILATDTGGKSEPVSVMDGRKRLRLTGVSGDQKSSHPSKNSNPSPCGCSSARNHGSGCCSSERDWWCLEGLLRRKRNKVLWQEPYLLNTERAAPARLPLEGAVADRRLKE